jgi:hypothetical protein
VISKVIEKLFLRLADYLIVISSYIRVTHPSNFTKNIIANGKQYLILIDPTFLVYRTKSRAQFSPLVFSPVLIKYPVGRGYSMIVASNRSNNEIYADWKKL